MHNQSAVAALQQHLSYLQSVIDIAQTLKERTASVLLEVQLSTLLTETATEPPLGADHEQR